MKEKQINKRRPELKAEEEGMALLNQAFSQFNLSTSKLQDSYNQLQRRVGMLDLELESKNKQLEASLIEKERSKDYLYNILESLNSGVVVIDEKGQITTFNRAVELITGVAKKEAEGENVNRVLRPLLPDDFADRFQSNNFIISEEECKLRSKDGRKVQVKVSVKPLRGKGLEGSLIILQDITQLRKLEEQAERTSRLTAMGEIAVSIAHEVRNPLGSIELIASLLRKEVKADEDKKRLTDLILTGVKSIDYIINNLLLFSRPQHPIFKNFSVHAFLDEHLLFVVPSFRQGNIELIKKYDYRDPLVLGDVELLKQVFFNLTWNAIQAMPQGGQLKIATEIVNGDLKGSVRPPRSLPFAREHSNKAGYLEIKFVDSGVGIADEDKEKIFNPFFTTKERGTGLGLAIVHTIIEVHNGMIGVESNAGQGSTFTISMPLVKKEKPAE
jgi:two-component system sensor histidine kinase FlrB